MSPTLNEMCRYMFNCAEKLEEEIKININDCFNIVTDKKPLDFRLLALEKVKDNHYKEILKILSDILINIRKIIYHEEYIRRVEYRKSNSADDISKCHFSSMQNLNTNCHIVPGSASLQDLPLQVEKVIRRERRRAASEISIYSLDAWESYLNNKGSEESLPVPVEVATIGRRKTSKRKQKKLISSTFNGFLDDNLSDASSQQFLGSTELSIQEEREDNSIIDESPISSDEEGDHQEIDDSGIPGERDDLIEDSDGGVLDEDSSVLDSGQAHGEENNEDTKPRIVDVVYKRNNSSEVLNSFTEHCGN